MAIRGNYWTEPYSDSVMAQMRLSTETWTKARKDKTLRDFLLYAEDHEGEERMVGDDTDTMENTVTVTTPVKVNRRHHPANRHERWVTNSGHKGKEVWQKEKEFRKEMRFNDTPAGYRNRNKIPGATSPKTWTNENYCKFRTVHAKRNDARERDAIRDYMNE